jgi:hypothetical protein
MTQAGMAVKYYVFHFKTGVDDIQPKVRIL